MIFDVSVIDELVLGETGSLTRFRLKSFTLGFLVFVPVTTIMARIGAKAVYKIDKKILSKIFGVFLICVSIRSFLEYLNIS